MWCSYARQNAVTLGNNTNNRLESSWKQMKEVVNSSMGLDECLASIMFYQTRAEQRLDDQATKVSVVHHHAYDRSIAMETIIPTQVLNPRWLLASLHENKPSVELPANPFAVCSILPQPKSPWDTKRKFREVNHIITSLNDVICGLGMHQYRVAMKALARVAILFKEKQFGVIDELSSPQSRCDVLEDAVESDDVIELGTTDSTPADGIGLNEAEWTKVIDVKLPLPGTMSSESDTLLGTLPIQLVTPSIQSGTLPSKSGTLPSQSGTLPSQSDTLSSKSGTQSGTQSGTVLSPETIDNATADFEIASPLRPRGRPKQKSKVKKAKRNLSVQIVNDDSILHDKQLSLAIIPETLSHESNYTSCAEKRMQFKLIVFERKMKPTITHVIAKLPASNPLLEPSDISRILTRDLLRRSDAKVTSLQKKWNGLAVRDIAVEPQAWALSLRQP
ncbi:unnamed protein product [Phytophthora fragariaefolia]|uniref:Unnamed protein product n=1 Tax=Phytophthora fragariaefolia TaxID=1490495 RepID=A0A9W6TTI6_9STRA|nr:unnamed protein product [Phytophthora fragariaefolia]